MDHKVSIVGGCGHVGLPLGIALATRSFDVTLIDINQQLVNLVNVGVMPFLEEGGEKALKDVLKKQLLRASTNPEALEDADVVVFVTGTPVDEHHNPKVGEVLKVIEQYLPMLGNKLIILRSTVYPGVIDLIEKKIRQKHGVANIAFCPERIVQGKGISEIYALPQIVSATTQEAKLRATKIFKKLTKVTVDLSIQEAELAKLMTNSWRYLEFAIDNQFYMMCESKGVDFYKVFRAIKQDYPRAEHFAGPGLAAGPCLFKDTMQLSAFQDNQFFLGNAGMLVNEGLPIFLLKQMEERLGGSLKDKKIALLGMSFKANNDDIRESLSYKLKKLVEFKMAEPLCHDPYQESEPLDQLLNKADGVILCVPHREYLELKIKKPFVDCWGVWK